MNRDNRKKKNTAYHTAKGSPAGRKNKGGKAGERYYAFFDAEYTCYMDNDRDFDRSHSNEVLSVGLVISDRSFHLVETFYSPVRPVYNPRLTRYCKSLTGLTQEEIDHAPSWEEVFEEMYRLLQEYPVKEILVWGSDAKTLTDDLEKNHFRPLKKPRVFIGMVRDVTKRLTARVFGNGMTVSLADMKYVCNMEHHTAHNALEDAMDLYRIAKACVEESYSEKRAEKLYSYIQERNTYHQFRRFKHPEKFGQPAADREMKQASLDYIKVVREVYSRQKQEIPTEILAFMDDVRSLVGMSSVECPKLEEDD